MTSQTFGFYVGIVYIQKGVELLSMSVYGPNLTWPLAETCSHDNPSVYEFPHSVSGGWLAVTVAILFSLVVYFLQRAGGLAFGPFRVRKFLADYAFALSAVFFSGFVHIPGYIKDANLEFLPITRSFYPSSE